MPITTSQDPVRNQYKVLSAIDECVSVCCSSPVRKSPSRTDMQREAVRATTRRWSRRGWRCPWHPDPRVGAAMTETSVRASHGPSPPRSACTKSWSGVYALCGELPLMPFASLVLGGAPLLTPWKARCCLQNCISASLPAIPVRPWVWAVPLSRSRRQIRSCVNSRLDARHSLLLPQIELPAGARHQLIGRLVAVATVLLAGYHRVGHGCDAGW